MRCYEITYKFDGETYNVYEFSKSSFDGRVFRKDEFYKNVLNRIESLVSAGAVILDVIERR